MKKSLLAVIAALLALAASAGSAGADPTFDSYIVVFKTGAVPNIPAAAQAMASANGGEVGFVYEHALEGFSLRIPAGRANALANDPRVAYIEPDQVIQADATQSPATWGLDRIDQRSLPLSNSYTYNQTGSGVNAYIIDTGIRASHQEFAGRMGNGFTAVSDGNGTNDCNGHGTHVAGTTGGTTYGVAKQVTLHAVRVLGCSGSGSTSGVIAGVDWVTNNHVGPSVANMSLGGSASSALDTAVANSIASGVSYAIAAGNSNANACNYSPARVAAANTVGATTSSDARASYSNFGTCVDLFAPGSSITSSWNTSDSATNTISGTSMATPHVTGALALYLQTSPSASPATATQALINLTTTGVVTNPGSGSPNRLLYSLFGGATQPPPPPPPPPPSGTELIVNGGFEGSASPWTLSGNAYWSNGGYQHSGTGYTVLGFYNSASGSEHQAVTIPSTATANLTFWLNVSTSETTTSTVYDRLFVEVRNTAGTLLGSLATYSNLNGTSPGVYSQKSFSLAAWRGQTVRLQFRATTDSLLATAFRVDDVSLK